MSGPTDPDPIFPVPPAQQKSPEVVHARVVKVLIVNPLALYGFQVTVVPLTLVIEMISGLVVELTVPVPIAMQNVDELHTREVSVFMVIPLCVNAFQVVVDPVLEMIVAALDVVPIAKQTGVLEVLGQVISVRPAIPDGNVSLVQVTVEPETTAVRTTAPEDFDPIATQLNVVPPVGQTMLVSCVTPEGSELLDQEVPLVETAAAPPDEL